MEIKIQQKQDIVDEQTRLDFIKSRLQKGDYGAADDLIRMAYSAHDLTEKAIMLLEEAKSKEKRTIEKEILDSKLKLIYRITGEKREDSKTETPKNHFIVRRYHVLALGAMMAYGMYSLSTNKTIDSLVENNYNYQRIPAKHAIRKAIQKKQEAQIQEKLGAEKMSLDLMKKELKNIDSTSEAMNILPGYTKENLKLFKECYKNFSSETNYEKKSLYFEAARSASLNRIDDAKGFYEKAKTAK